jgi:DivIVA domain-containing protein
MDQEIIEEIRSATFSLVRKGYDPGEVRLYLSRLAERLEQEAPTRPGSEAVRRELELVGEKTAGILAQAEEGAERMHSEALREASNLLSKAREDAQATRVAADEYAAETRGEADAYSAQAHSVAEEGARSELAELSRRRDEIHSELTRLAGEIQRTVQGQPAHDLPDGSAPSPGEGEAAAGVIQASA